MCGRNTETLGYSFVSQTVHGTAIVTLKFMYSKVVVGKYSNLMEQSHGYERPRFDRILRFRVLLLPLISTSDLPNMRCFKTSEIGGQAKEFIPNQKETPPWRTESKRFHTSFNKVILSKLQSSCIGGLIHFRWRRKL